MGRGRAKAKQTKVARELKYNAPQTDFDRLQQELSSGGPLTTRMTVDDDDGDDSSDDRYGSWAEDDGG